MNLVLQTLSKAGWVTDAQVLPHGASRIKVILKPTESGAERFRAILVLMRELQAVLGALTPEEMGYVCELAAKFAPNKESLSWPAQLPGLTTPED